MAALLTDHDPDAAGNGLIHDFLDGGEGAFLNGGGKRQTPLRGIDLLLRHGERVGLIGANGAGKSVLGRVLAASFLMGGVIILVTQSAQRAGLGCLVTIAIGGIAGALVYLLAARLLGVREIGRFVSAVLGHR